MADSLYTITVKYGLHHSVGEIVPTAEEVAAMLEHHFEEGDELGVQVSRVTVRKNEETDEPEEGTRIEGCRVAIDEIEVQEATIR